MAHVQPTDCSLRQAVDAPSANEARLIILHAGRYELTQGPLQLSINEGETIQGAGARLTTIDGNSVDTVFIGVEGNDLAAINNVTITGGNATGFTGGAISVDGAATLSLNRSTLTRQSIRRRRGRRGLRNLNASASTITGNVTNPPQSFGEGGGGIYVNNGDTNLANVTISGNTAVDPLVGARGGGIYVTSGSLVARNVTIAGNSADVGGGVWNGTGVVSLFSTIVTGNTPATCVGTPFGGDHSMGTDNCGLSSTANPLLGALANNGGPDGHEGAQRDQPGDQRGRRLPDHRPARRCTRRRVRRRSVRVQGQALHRPQAGHQRRRWDTDGGRLQRARAARRPRRSRGARSRAARPAPRTRSRPAPTPR